MHACLLSHFSRVPLFVTLWTVGHQAPLCIGFSRQKYWSGLPCPPLGNLPDPGIKAAPSTSPALAERIFNPWVEKIPWRRKWQPAPVFLPGESHRQGRLVGYSPWGHRESDITEHTTQVLRMQFSHEFHLLLSVREGDIRVSLRFLLFFKC